MAGPTADGRRPGLTPFVLVMLAGAVMHGLTLWMFHSNFPFMDQPIRDAAFWDLAARTLTNDSGPFYRAPGYILFLKLVRGFIGSAPLFVPILQACLGLGATWLVMRAALSMFGFREAILAGLMVVGSGVVYLFAMRLLPETPALFLAALMIHAFAAAEEGQPVPMDREEQRAHARSLADGASAVPLRGAARFHAVLAGAASGLLAITRAEYLAAAFLILAILFSRAGRRTRPWALGVLFAAGFSVVAVPVVVHNFSKGAGNPVATSGGVALYRANRAGVDPLPDPVKAGNGGFSGYALPEEMEADSLAAAGLGDVPAPGPEWGYWVSRAVREIAADPAAWAGLLARKALVLIGRPEVSHNLAHGLELDRIPVLRAASVPFNFLALAGLFGLFLAGGAGARRTARVSRLPSSALLVAALAAGLAFFPEADVRVAMIPVLAIFSAHALVRADLAWRAGERRGVLIAVISGLVLIGLTSIPRYPLRNPVREARLLVEAATGIEAAGRTGEAGVILEEALHLDPSNVDALVHLGQIALGNTELVEAIGWFEKAVAAAPEDFSLRNNLGILYYQAQRFEDADREMEKAANLLPDDPGPWFYRGQCHRKLEDPAGAEAFFHEAITRDPRYVGAYVRLIELLLEEGRDADARLWADRAGVHGVAMPGEIAARLR